LDVTAPSPDYKQTRQRWNVLSALCCAHQQDWQIMQSGGEEAEQSECRAAGPLEIFDGKREWAILREKADRLEDTKE
jgi:hypothetical protein